MTDSEMVMNLGAIFVGLALLVLVIPFVISPFRGMRYRKKESVVDPESPRTYRERVLLALRELDFDYQTEKIIEEDYTRIRNQLLADAAEAIQLEQQEDARIEEMIRSHRNAILRQPKCPDCSRQLIEGDRFCPGCGAHLVALCPSCGYGNQLGDNYCARCGKQLKQ